MLAKKLKDMKKKIYAILLLVFLLGRLFGQYVTVNCDGFLLNGSPYKPLVMNYMIDFAHKTSAYNSFYPSPLWSYSDDWATDPNVGNPPYFLDTNWVAPPGYSSRQSYYNNWTYTSEEIIAKDKLGKDLRHLRALGFNTIRVFVERKRARHSGPFALSPISGTYPNYNISNYTNYFSVVDEFLDSLNNNGIKAILVLANYKDWEDHEGYKSFLETIADHFKNNTNVMAYDLFNEPDWSYPQISPNDKYKITNIVTEWYYTIKKHDPNHLITIGIDESINSIGWDPNVLKIDFASFHFYPKSDDPIDSKKVIFSLLYWASKTIKIPWIIGETGYSGTGLSGTANPLTGSENDQKGFADATLQRSKDCNCKGYSWWQYQEVLWGNDFDNYLGIKKKFGSYWDGLEGVDKPVANSFPAYNTMTPTSNCTIPASSSTFSYYNFTNTNSYFVVNGYVKDESNIPVKNAYVRATINADANIPNDPRWGRYYWTYTDNNGFFQIKADEPLININNLWLSCPGYNTYSKEFPVTNGQTYNITKVNYNKWTKKQTNDYNNYIAGWQITDWDKFYNADFDVDGEDELLCMQNHGVANDWTTLLTYNNSQANWQQIWTNGGNDWIGPWHHETQYGDRFITGDFDGNGTGDELLCMQVTSTNVDWCSLLKYSSGAWSYATTNSTNSGNDYIGPWKINTTDEFKVGDFNNDGKDDLFCVRKTSGTNDLFSILNFNPSNGTWNYLYLGGQPMTNWNGEWIGGWPINPTDKYYIGDYDGNGTDDILFAQCTSGSADWITLQTILPNGTFSSLWSNSGSNSVAMYPYRNNLIIGNYDEDINTEIMGFATQAAKFDFSANQFSSEWSTGTSLRFSDWYVISQTPNYAFIKTHKWSPEQLMVFRKYGSNYLVNMYSYNRTDDCPITNPNGIMPNDNDLKQFSPEISDLNVYPNPTYGDLTIVVNQDSYDNSLINIFNIQGQIVKTINMNGFEAGIQQMNITMDDLSTGFYFINFTNNKNSLTKKVSYIK